MVEAGAKGRTLMGGSAAMREAGKKYLPKFTAESDEAYKERLALSWLFNGYRKTVRDMAGRVFDKPIALGDDVPARIAEWAENIDLAGNDISVFALEVFRAALAGPAIGYIMVDAPTRAETTTQAQAAAQNLRPYLVHLRAEDVLGWKTTVINNVTVLSQIRIAETVHEEKNEFEDDAIDQVRVLDRTDGGNVRVRIFRKSDKMQWTQYGEETTTGLPGITIVPVYLNRTGFFTGAPVLDDLAEVNIAHWQSQSDQRNILHVARVPILFGKGIPDDKPITISTSSATTSSDPQADLKWVEHSGKAIDAGRQDLKDLEFQMEAHGLQLLVAQPGGESATGSVLDAKKETSQLSMMADALQDALEQALQFMADYAGEADGGSVVVNKEFTTVPLSAQELQLLLNAVNTGNMSRDTFLRELVRRGVVSDAVDPDDEAERISDEGGDDTDPPPLNVNE